MTIVIRPHWRRNPPASLALNPDGTVTFKGPTGNVLLPEDYLAFMQVTEGLGMRSDDSWFLTHYSDGPKILQLEFISNVRSLMLSTWGYQENAYHDGYTVPKGYVHIGQCDCDDGYTDLQLCCIPGHPDYGRVFTWLNTQDPWMTSNNMHGLGLAANSFTELMNNLTFEDRL